MARKRFLISLILAIIFHLVVLLVLQAVIKGQADNIPEYSGPLYVNLEEVPVIQARPDEEAEPQAAVTERVEPERVEPVQTEPQPTEPAPTEPQPAAPERIEPQPATPQPITPRPAAPPESPPQQFEQPLPIEETAPFVQPAAERPERPPEIEEQPEEPLLALDNLDQALSQPSDGATPSTEGSAAGITQTGDTPSTAQSGSATEGLNIQWEDPAEGREPTSQPKPVVPRWVGQQGLRLRVVVSFLLTPQGYLTNVMVRESSGYPDVDAAVLEALRRWTFKPVKSTKTVRGRIPYIILPE